MLQNMASRGFYDIPSNRSPPTSTNSPYQSCRSLSETDSPIFRSPRSSPEAEIMHNYGTFASEIESDEQQLVTQENHFARADSQSESSMSIMFQSTASPPDSFQSVSFWRHLR